MCSRISHLPVCPQETDSCRHWDSVVSNCSCHAGQAWWGFFTGRVILPPLVGSLVLSASFLLFCALLLLLWQIYLENVVEVKKQKQKKKILIATLIGLSGCKKKKSNLWKIVEINVIRDQATVNFHIHVMMVIRESCHIILINMSLLYSKLVGIMAVPLRLLQGNSGLTDNGFLNIFLLTVGKNSLLTF